MFKNLRSPDKGPQGGLSYKMRLTDVESFRGCLYRKVLGPALFFLAGAFAPGVGALDYQNSTIGARCDCYRRYTVCRYRCRERPEAAKRPGRRECA